MGTTSIPATHAACLKLENISKSFGGLSALDKVSFQVEQGSRQALIGPNGAGKTTLFNLISGALNPSEGRILYYGKDITHLPTHKRAALGIARTFQITNLFLNLTVFENLQIACQALKKTKFVMFRSFSSYPHLVDRTTKLLREFNLWEKRNELIRSLSYGEQRQIEVTLALAGQPRLLLLDEPAAGLSPPETQDLAILLNRLDRNITVILVEHDMDLTFQVVERIKVLYQGRLMAEGRTDEIKRNPNVQQVYLGARDAWKPFSR
jgi:branched-chain amino acid transport system ATP-binding protein